MARRRTPAKQDERRPAGGAESETAGDSSPPASAPEPKRAPVKRKSVRAGGWINRFDGNGWVLPGEGS